MSFFIEKCPLIARSSVANLCKSYSSIESCKIYHHIMHSTSYRLLKSEISSQGLKYLDRKCSNLAFVPKHEPCSEESISRLQTFINNHEKLFVITGAGISTESGIPDYRSEGVGLYSTSTKRPIQIKV